MKLRLISKVSLTILLNVVCDIFLYSQPTNSYTKNIVLPSAEVSSLGKYSDIATNNFNGLPTIDIPIYTVADGTLSLPLSLSYHASGQVVSQVASRVGAGWSLNAGGMISRTVLGLRDEGSYGYYYNGANVPLPTDCNYYNWVVNAAHGNAQYETEPDIFSYNIGGYTGKFYFNMDGGTPVIKTIPKSDIKIIPHFQGTTSYVDHLDYFTIIGTDGTKYFLGKYNGKDGMELSQFSGTQNPIATGWQVVRIESADGKYYIDINYQDDNYEYVFQLPKNSMTCVGSPQNDFTSFKSKKISSIVSRTETVTFNDGIDKLDVRPHYQTPGLVPKSLGSISIVSGAYSKKFNLIQSHWIDNEFPEVTSHLNYLLKLDAIQELSADNSIVNPSTTFEYTIKAGNPNFYPNRLSKAIDHWGYYNGKTSNNTTNTLNIPFHNPVPCQNGATCSDLLLPNGNYNSDRETHEPSMMIGSLKKIVYPTGGNSEFVFEANDYNTTEMQTNITELIRVDHAYPFPGNCNTSTTPYNTPASYTFSTLSNIKYTYTVTPAIACPSAPNLAIEIKMRNASTNALIASSGQINFNPGTSNSNTALLSALFPSTPLGIAVKYEITGVNCAAQFKVFSEITQNVNINKKIGGLRIKTITQKDGGFGSPDKVTEYQYRKPSNNNYSSGVLFYKPQYWFTNTWVFNHSLPCASLYTNCGPCSNGIQDGGENGIDCGGNCDTPCGIGGGCHTIFTEVPVVPLSSFEGYHVGYENVTITELDGSKSAFEYFVEQPFYTTGTYLEDNKYPIEPHQARVNTGNLKVEQKLNINNLVVAKNENFIYLNDAYEVSSDRMMKVHYYTTTCPGYSGGGWSMSNSYHIRTKPFRVATSQNTLDNVLRSEVFSYDPANRFLMPVSKEFVNSDGKVHREEYTYNHDYDNSQGIRDALVSKNMISSPFRTVIKVDGIHLDGPETGYAWYDLATGVKTTSSIGSFPRPYQFFRYEKSYDAAGNLLSTGGITLQTTINAYDIYGNVKQVTALNWQPETFEWFSNGLLKKRTFLNHIVDYTYYTGTRLLSSIKDIDGQFTYFEYDKLSRLSRKVNRKINTTENVKTEYTYHFKEASGDTYNWVKSRTTYTPITNSGLILKETKDFVDGLGRPIQTVKVNHSPNNKDVVHGKVYDNKGRVYREYLPVESNVNTGAFYTIPVGTKYTETVYEASPLNRPISITPPGTVGYPGSWYSTSMVYGANSASDVVNLNTGSYYAANTLTKVVKTDPMNNRTIVFKDKNGREVMTWNTDVSYTNHARTYTLYDNKDRVSTIVPPGATLSTLDLIYKYTYDQDDKMLTKSVPGKGIEKMIYNDRDLVTFFQDAKWVNSKDWLHSKYDDYGRMLNNGRYTHATTADPAGNTNVSYTDQYKEVGYYTLLSDGVSLGKIKQTKDKILGTSNTWIQKDFTYDTYGRVSTITGSNHLYNNPTAESEIFTYDFADNTMTQNRVHKPSATVAEQQTINKRWTYDASGRVKDHFTTLNGIETKISSQNYNFKDELTEKNIGALAPSSSTFLQSIDYTYNDQGWLTKINQPTLTGTDLAFPTSCTPGLPNPGAFTASNPDKDVFYMELNYDVNSTGITSLPTNEQKSGNIGQIAWKVRGRDLQAYNYTYDFLNRMTTSTYYDVNASNVATATNRFNENLTYDSRGNIMTLNRTGHYTDVSNVCQYNTIDNLTYNYTANTNRLASVTDATVLAQAKAKGYNPGVGGVGYGYDAVGNMTSDTYKGITNITYNYLNLPQIIQWGNTKSIVHSYDANGIKLSKQVKTGTSTPFTLSTFETGWDNWIDGGTNCDRVTTGGLSGSYSILIQSVDATSNIQSPTYALSAFDSVRVDFKFKAESFETSEDFFLEYSSNGGTSWIPLKNYVFNTDFVNNVVYDRYITISALLSSTAKFRFRCDAGDTTDKIYVDNILVTGYTWTSQSLQDYVLGVEYNKLGTAARRVEAI